MAKRKNKKTTQEYNPVNATEVVDEARIEEQEKIDFVMKLVESGEEYLDKFKDTWDDINSKIRTENPDGWEEKESWQTKVVVPMFAKGSEVGNSYMNKMLFGSKRWFACWGTKTELNKYSEAIMALMDAIFDRGRFTFNKNFALQEACDIGTSFIKAVVRPDKRGIDFPWVSAYACFCDVDARHDFYKSRMWSHNYRYDLHQMIADVQAGSDLWSRDGVNRLIEQGVGEWNTLSQTKPSEAEEKMSVVQNIDGTSQMTVTTAFANVEIFEYWGLVPVKKYFYSEVQKKDLCYTDYKMEKLVIANRNTILSEDDNPYRRIPAFAIRTKKRPYDLYGMGFHQSSIGLQDLATSMLCFGYDSSKLTSMDIVIMDKTKANDQDSIVVKPMAIWDVRDPEKVRFTRANNGMAALDSALRGVTFLDSLYQDASGITRQVSANQSLPGTPGGGEDTLGIYQYQLQMADQRFLDQAKFIEDDFEHPLLHFVLDCILNPDLISQEFINEILGFKQEVELDANGQPTGIVKNVPVLDQQELIDKLNELRQKDKSADFNFTMLGLTQFIEKINILKKLDGLITRATTNQSFAPYTNVKEAVRRWYEMSEIPDWEDLYMENAPVTPPPPQIGPNGVVPQNTINPVAAPKEGVIPPVPSTGGV